MESLYTTISRVIILSLLLSTYPALSRNTTGKKAYHVRHNLCYVPGTQLCYSWYSLSRWSGGIVWVSFATIDSDNCFSSVTYDVVINIGVFPIGPVNRWFSLTRGQLCGALTYLLLFIWTSFWTLTVIFRENWGGGGGGGLEKEKGIAEGGHKPPWIISKTHTYIHFNNMYATFPADIYWGILLCSQVFAPHLEIGHPSVKSTIK